MVEGKIFSPGGEPICIYDSSPLKGLSFQDQEPTNYVCQHATADCAGLTYSMDFFVGSMLNLKPEYRWFIFSSPDNEWIINPKASKVVLSLPNKIFKSTNKKSTSFQPEDDHEDAYSRFLSTKASEVNSEFKDTGKKGVWLNNYYLKAVSYKKKTQNRNKIVVSYSSRGQQIPILTGSSAIGRWGIVKKDNYTQYVDIYGFGDNAKYMLSTEEFSAMKIEDKVR